MLSQAENERLTTVAPGTPGGDLMRRYWWPIAATAELSSHPTKAVRVLGENLTLYRTPQGRFGLTGERCPHRAMDMSYGIPENEGLRCAYHGWLYDFEGQCIEQPAEPPDSRFKEKVQIKAYQAEEMGGLVWAYLGPEPIPYLPRWDLFVWEGVTRSVGTCVLPCNWLQTVDNALDPVHVEHLHNHYGSWSLAQRTGSADWTQMSGSTTPELVKARGSEHRKIGFDRFRYGIVKRRITIADEQDENWRVGHPIVFPTMLRVGGAYQHTYLIRTPIDNEHTLHVRYQVTVPEPGKTAEPQEVAPHQKIEVFDADGRILGDSVPAQDILAWMGQGTIADRTLEHLALSDVGVIMFRRLLDEQIKVVEDGGDPICVFRNADEARYVELPQEKSVFPDSASGTANETTLNGGDAEVQAILRP